MLRGQALPLLPRRVVPRVRSVPPLSEEGRPMKGSEIVAAVFAVIALLAMAFALSMAAGIGWSIGGSIV